MTRREAIEFGEERADLFGGKMEEFIKLSVEALKESEHKNAQTLMMDLIFEMHKLEAEEIGVKIRGKEIMTVKLLLDNIDELEVTE